MILFAHGVLVRPWATQEEHLAEKKNKANPSATSSSSCWAKANKSFYLFIYLF
jgi:Tfp pilus assembly protein PilE